MITAVYLKTAAEVVRRQLEKGNVDRKLLAKLYGDYADVGDVKSFIDQALEMFPRLSCGVASAYLRHELGEGVIVRGRYGLHDHTFLRLDDGTIVDVTADQYGGPKIHVSPLSPPWSLKR